MNGFAPTDTPPSPPQSVTAVINQGVSRGLSREDVPMDQKDVLLATPKVTAGVMNAIANSDDVAVVPVQSPLVSKINWTALITAGLTLLTVFGLPLDPGQKADTAAALVTVGSLLTIVWKTYFTRSITSGSK